MGKLTKMQAPPPLEEFIDLAERREQSRAKHGFQPMKNRATVAVYNSRRHRKLYQVLTIRMGDDIARRFNLIEGARMTCLVHPDQQFIALRPGDRRGAALFRKHPGGALTYQTTLKGRTLEPQLATPATVSQSEDTLMVALTPA